MLVGKRSCIVIAEVFVEAGYPACACNIYCRVRSVIIDLVYARETPLLKAARSAGARATGGLNMLLYQAAKSFEHWTGREAPLKEMKKALVSNAPGSGLTRAG